ncbi:MAG: hypothetical protein HYZ53_25115 [Planctomycetes bacterium]|nr:hypothetical protein [Planctomycetota bacterium]
MVKAWVAAAAALWVGLLAGAVYAGDCAECTPKGMCAKHKADEKSAIAVFDKAYKDKAKEGRILALQGLSKVNDDHANQRSVAAAQKMAIALHDPDASVREEAAKLLGGTQEARTAIAALGPVAKAAVDKLDKAHLPKARGTPEYDADLSWLRAVFEGLENTHNKDAGPFLAAGFASKNADVIKEAGRYCAGLRTKEVMTALMDAMEKLAVGNGDEVAKAWQFLSGLLPKLTGNKSVKPQVDSSDAPRFARDWKEWWKKEKDKPEWK